MFRKRRNRRARIVGGALAALHGLVGPTAASAQYFPPEESLSAMLGYLVEAGIARGVVFATVESDGSTRVLVHGDAGAGARPLGVHSVFDIGSITKVFTGTLLAEMAARGELSLTDPVSKHVPDGVSLPSFGGREMTLVDLATHHSGLPRDPDNHAPANPADPLADYTIDQLHDFVSGSELRHEPGSEGGYAYSNVGYGLLGHILAGIGGGSYEAVLRERVLEPLGMTRSGTTVEGDLRDWMVRGHDARGNPVSVWTATDAIAGAGALRASAEDVLRFLVANLRPEGNDVGRAIREAQRPRRAIAAFASIGLGWQSLAIDGRRIVVHDGGSRGFRASIGYDPDRRVGYLLLMNQIGRDASLGLDLLLHGPAPTLPTVEVGGDRLGRYAGEYEIEPGWLLAIEPDHGHLTLRTPGRERMRMYASSETSFFLRRLPWRLSFTADDPDRANGVVLDIEGVRREGRMVTAESPRTPLSGDVLDIPLGEDDIARYEGVYRVRLGQTILRIQVTGVDGQLVWQSGSAAPGRLLNQGEHTFIHADDAGLRVVFAGVDARAAGITLHQLGLVVPGRREP